MVIGPVEDRLNENEARAEEGVKSKARVANHIRFMNINISSYCTWRYKVLRPEPWSMYLMLRSEEPHLPVYE